MLDSRDIIEAKEVLGLPERASLKEIKTSYRRLLRRWHPDTCKDDIKTCEEMTKRITDAYTCIRAYCSQYKYSFAEEEVARYRSAADWWYERFGDDPVWGSRKKP